MRKVYGIDIGSTYSRIAFINESGQPEVIPNEGGELDIPSIVFFEPEGNTVVGKTAKEKSIDYPARAVSNVRTIIGDLNWAFQCDGKSYKSEDIIAILFKYLVNNANKVTGQEISEIVFASSIEYTIKEADTVRQAGVIAGLNVIATILQPVATTIAYNSYQINEQKAVIVYDLGGNTFKVSLVEMNDGNASLIFYAGSEHLGGNDWNKAILGYLAPQYLQQDLRSPHYQRVFNVVEEMKTRLSHSIKAEVPVKFRGYPIKYTELTHTTFNGLTSNLLERTVNYTKQVVEKAKQRGYSDIEILLAGGATLMPQIQDGLRQFNIPILQNDPQHIAAKGTAIYANIILQKEKIQDLRGSAGFIEQNTKPETFKRYEEPTSYRDWRDLAAESKEFIARFELLVAKYTNEDEQRQFDFEKSRTIKEISNHDAFSIEKNLRELESVSFHILYNKFDFWILWFESLKESLSEMTDKILAESLIVQGNNAIEVDNIETLREVVAHLVELVPVNRHEQPPHLMMAHSDYDNGVNHNKSSTILEKRGTPEVPGGRVDLVNFSVTSPPIVQPDYSFVVIIWAHLQKQRSKVIQMAQEAAGGCNIKISTQGPMKLERGTVITVRLILDGMVVNPSEATILWEGEIGNATFGVKVPKEIAPGQKVGIAAIYIKGFQVAIIHFELGVGNKSADVETINAMVKQHRTAFASYASEDRNEVLKRIQGMQKANPQLDIFLDVDSLRSGLNWWQEIQKAILSRDVFYLFWSAYASKSTWVEKEWHVALRKRGLYFIDPCPLVSPNEVPPPEELEKLHFFDRWSAFGNHGETKN